jgi:cytochrome c oxidase subunit 3
MNEIASEVTPASAPSEPHLEHFDSFAHQAHAARLGMWVFLSSEILLFAGFFALFAAYRVEHSAAFHEAVRANTKVLGSINTFVLLTSSTLVAGAVEAFREGKRRLSGLMVLATVLLGAVFLALKTTEYLEHFREGIFPGGRGAWFVEHTTQGLPTFWTLYFIATGLHALHIIVGMTILGTLGTQVLRGTLPRSHVHHLELGAIYWHLVDVVWIFLWPLFYLA